MEPSVALERLAALAQETRIAAFRLLVASGAAGLPAGEIARRLATPANTMSSHLAVLERAGLASSRRDGRLVRYRAEPGAVQDLVLHLMADCCGGRPELCGPIVALAERLAGTAPAAAGVEVETAQLATI